MDVEDSISFANNYENFLKLMELKGYEIRQNNGAALLKPMGEKRFIRLTDISAHYTKESIEDQIEKGIRRNTVRTENRTPRIIGCRKNYRRYIPPTTYQKAFLAKIYRTGQIKRKPYSQMWRYREEAAKFEKLQSQYLYLCRHSIRSAEELEKRKKDLDVRMDDLDEARHQIYKRRYPHKSALALLKIIEENETRASYYKQGSLFYAPNYEKWKEAAEILVQKGYTIKQVSEMDEAYQTELAFVAKAKRELKKEENLISGILSGGSRTQVMEIAVPEIKAPHKAQKNIEETGSIRKAISAGKGGDAEKTGSVQTEMSAHNGKKQPEQAR